MQVLLAWLAAAFVAISQDALRGDPASISSVAKATPLNLFVRQDTYSTSPLPTATEGAGYLPATIAQPSVTSTTFNAAETNAGGTTNSAGTFDVVSLSRSSNYDTSATSLVQTTTFSPSSASYVSQKTVTTTYNTNTATSVQYGAVVDTTTTNPLPSISGTSIVSGGGDDNAAASLDGLLGSWKQVGLMIGGVAVGAGMII